jgi:hypothetical protein
MPKPVTRGGLAEPFADATPEARIVAIEEVMWGIGDTCPTG